MRNVLTSPSITMPYLKASIHIRWMKIFPVLIMALLFVGLAGAQDLATGQAAIDQAATDIGGYFTSIRGVVFVIAGIIALLGSVRVLVDHTSLFGKIHIKVVRE